MDVSTGTSEISGGLGAILTQGDENNEEKVIVYASRQLLKNEKTTLHSYWKCKPWYGVWNTSTHISEEESFYRLQATRNTEQETEQNNE